MKTGETGDSWREWNRKKWERKNFFMYLENSFMCPDGRHRNRWSWYSESLDPDIARILQEYNVHGGKLLDIGTCSGSQAIGLAKLGFEVTGTDVSGFAIERARANLAREEDRLEVEFMVDDILDTRLAPNQFDLILDRGCFHSIYHFGKDRYIENLLRILEPRGMVLLKTMSPEEERFRDHHTVGNIKFPMPHRFDRELLRDCFMDSFIIHETRDSFFYSSNLEDPARALLTILSRQPGEDA